MSAGDGSRHRLGVETSGGGPGPLPTRGDASWEVRELQPTGLTEDGRYLLLVAADDRGKRFRVRADERLRGLTRGATGRPGPYQPRVDSALTPREIQARLRAGQTASEVARAAGVPIERIQRYEAPVLAERARVVDEAQAARPPVRGEEPLRPLGELVAERLARWELGEDAVHWDAWRRVDGTWTVQMVFPRDESMVTARWIWDPAVRRVRAEDEEAAALLAPLAAPLAAPLPGPAPAAAIAVPPAYGVPTSEYSATMSMTPPPPQEAPQPGTAPVPALSPAPLFSPATPSAPAPAAPEAVPLTLVHMGPDSGSARGEGDRRTAVPADLAVPADRYTADAEADATPDQAPRNPAPTRAAGRRGRREVPAWDDIVFGTKGG